MLFDLFKATVLGIVEGLTEFILARPCRARAGGLARRRPAEYLNHAALCRCTAVGARDARADRSNRLARNWSLGVVALHATSGPSRNDKPLG